MLESDPKVSSSKKINSRPYPAILTSAAQFVDDSREGRCYDSLSSSFSGSKVSEKISGQCLIQSRKENTKHQTTEYLLLE